MRSTIDNTRCSLVSLASQVSSDVFYRDVCELWLERHDRVARRLLELRARKLAGELQGPRSVHMRMMTMAVVVVVVVMVMVAHRQIERLRSRGEMGGSGARGYLEHIYAIIGDRWL